MLKGLKKKHIENQKPVQSPSNVDQTSSQCNLIQLNRQALLLFTSGQTVQLKAKLQFIRLQEQHYFADDRFLVPGSIHKPKQSSRFAQVMSFQEEEAQPETERRRRKKQPRVRAERTVDYCVYCPENEQLCLLSASNYAYVALAKVKTFRKLQHYIIAPVEHQQTRIGLDSAIEDEIRNYQKCLIQMMERMNLHAVFLEQFSSSNSHIYIQCIGIPLKKAYDLPFFFKQALEGVEGNWTSHKNIIDIRKEKGGLQKQIPKQIKYCYIDFGLGYGYAHVIENEKLWDRGFLYEVVAAALGLESFHVKTTEEYLPEQIQLKSKEFDKIWKEFDWTALIQQ